MKLIEPWMQPSAGALAQSIADGLRPDEKLGADEWAERNRMLPPDTPEPGEFRFSRTPYLLDIHRTMSAHSPTREGWWMKPHQVGGSVTGENLIGSWICTAAGAILVVFPTLDDAKQWELSRFEPMRANTRDLRKRIGPSDRKGSDNTKLRKKFPGGVMRLIGANRVGAMKSATIRYVKYEEPDEYQMLTQGRVVELTKARTSNFGRKAKIYGDGTPTFDDRSEIQRQVRRGDQRNWYMHCPDCGHAQVLTFEALRWTDGDPSTSKALCVECGALNDEATWKAKNYAPRPARMTEEQAAKSGRAFWRATAKGEPGVASWLGLEAVAAPLGWRPWPMLVIDWLAAQGDEEKLRTFFNNMRGMPYQDTLRSDVGADVLQKRAEPYEPMTCPAGGLLITAGVDTQDNRLAVTLRAWGRGEESWGLWHSEIYGDTSSPEPWEKLKQLLDAPIRHASGHVVRVTAAAIDAGGHRGEDVYAFCKAALARKKHWFPIRGASPYDAPMLSKPRKHEFTWRGRPVRGGVELRWVGTQAIKTLIDGRLKRSEHGAGAYHFPLAYGADYFKQMRAERREWRRNREGKKALWWVKGSDRNEAWDTEVYNYAAFLYATNGQHLETVWRNKERKFAKPPDGELVASVSPADDATTPTPAEAPAQPSFESTPQPAAPAPAPDPAAQAPAAPPPAQKKKRGRIRGGFGGIGNPWVPL